MLVLDMASRTRVAFPFNCPHDLWCDPDGNFVLVCKTFKSGKGVAVNEDALTFLGGLEAAGLKQIRLHAKPDNWTWEGPLADLPHKEPIEVQHPIAGRNWIRVYDKEDLFPDLQDFSARPSRSLPAASNVGGAAIIAPAPTPMEVIPGPEEITFKELQRRVERTFTNPGYRDLAALTAQFPLQVEIRGGVARFFWQDAK
jgi:hypothetical protein